VAATVAIMAPMSDRSSAAPASRPRVVLLRGHSANPWDLRPWGLLADRYDITCLVTPSNEFDTAGLPVPVAEIGSRRDRMPPGRVGRALAYAAGDRYADLDEALAGVDIVHGADLATWFSAQAAQLRPRLGFRLALTIWETIPMLDAFRWPRERGYRTRALDAADMMVAASERARRALWLEGVADERIRVAYPGIDTNRFAARAPVVAPGGGGRAPGRHLILSPGRLVWEKGHQDVIRAVAALRRGLLGTVHDVALLVVGSGPEEKKLRRHAAELGLGDAIEFRTSVAYDEMPAVYHRASAMVLASLPRKGWEEQFGMVLAEGLASGTSIVAARSGAIPEVVGGDAQLVEPGDWYAIAQALEDGPLRRPPAQRVAHDPKRVARYSTAAAAERLDSVYRELLAR
jgi:glycosyltransferase involved in cell wall biosynthesis